jgi:hypothetical protein
MNFLLSESAAICTSADINTPGPFLDISRAFCTGTVIVSPFSGVAQGR